MATVCDCVANKPQRRWNSALALNPHDKSLALKVSFKPSEVVTMGATGRTVHAMELYCKALDTRRQRASPGRRHPHTGEC